MDSTTITPNLPGFFPSVESRYHETGNSWTRRQDEDGRNPSFSLKRTKKVFAKKYLHCMCAFPEKQRRGKSFGSRAIETFHPIGMCD